MLVGAQLSVAGVYRPPVASSPAVPPPPPTIISLPVHTAVCDARSLENKPVHVSYEQPPPTTGASVYDANRGACFGTLRRARDHQTSKDTLGQVTVSTRARPCDRARRLCTKN